MSLNQLSRRELSVSNEMPYFLGCPAWSILEWRGTFLPKTTPQSDFLKLYSKTFNTVEGNSFFYALPRTQVVERWVRETEPGFKFCMNDF